MSRSPVNVRTPSMMGAKNLRAQRRNLFHVCRLSVKSLVEKSCFETIDEQCEELQNFLAIMEHLLCHRLKAYQTWYGSDEPRYFWDFIRASCKKVPHNCLSSITALEYPRTARGKGRAWLRSVLMEKRLSEYLTTALQQSTLVSRMYLDGSVMLTEEMYTLSGILLGLNSIDFSFDIRGTNLDFPSLPIVDFTPYLKFHQRPEDEVELEECSDSGDTWKEKYCRLDSQLKVICEQKGYLEELVRLRESQLEEVQNQRQSLVETLQHYEAESRRERHQLETVIIELQTQLRSLKDEHCSETQKMEMMLLRQKNKPPAIALTHFPSQSDRDSHGSSEVFLLSSASPSPSPSKLPTARPGSRSSMAADGRSLTSIDTRSIVSAASLASATREDSQSMIVMAGSFTSETSKLSSEMSAQSGLMIGEMKESANQMSPLASGGRTSANEKTETPVNVELVTLESANQKPEPEASTNEKPEPLESIDEKPQPAVSTNEQTEQAASSANENSEDGSGGKEGDNDSTNEIEANTESTCTADEKPAEGGDN